MDLIWTLTVIFAAESFGVLGQDALPDVQMPNFSSTQIEAFKKFLEKSLSSEGAYNKYLLVSTDIFPALSKYATLSENGADMSTDEPFYDHFKHCVEEMLASEEKINDAIYRLFSVGALDKMIESEATNSFSFSDLTTKMTFPESTDDFTQSDLFSKYSSDVDIVDLDPHQQIAFEKSQYEIISETSPDSHLTTAATSPEVSFTTDYIKFLTNEHPESSSPNSVSKDKINKKDQCSTGTVFLENDLSSVSPMTESYKQFLETSSKSAYDTDQTEATEDYSTNIFSTDSSTIYIEESSLRSSDDTPTDFVSLKLGPTREETIEIMPPSEEDLTRVSQNYEDMTENQKMDIQTNEPKTNFESEEASSPSLRVAKEIRQNKSETGSSSRIDLIRGTPGLSYPNYEDIPDKEFNCENKMHIPGFYADMETRCQVFHVCWPGRRESFLCPIGTTFNQAILACDYWYNSNCSVSSTYFDVNAAFKELDTPKSGMTGPMIDTLIKDTKKVPDEIISSSGEISELYEADVHFSETIAKHELSKIWKFLPVKAKIFIQPQLKLEDIIGKTKLKRSKKGITEEKENTNGRRDDISKDRKKSKEMVESILLEVLRNVIQS